MDKSALWNITVALMRTLLMESYSSRRQINIISPLFFIKNIEVIKL